MAHQAHVPRDDEQFKKLSPDKPAVMPPDWTFPIPEELTEQSLRELAEMYKLGADGN